MTIRHTVIAAALLTVALAACNKRDEAPATPPPAESATTPSTAPAMPSPPSMAPPAAAPDASTTPPATPDTSTPPATDSGTTADKKP